MAGLDLQWWQAILGLLTLAGFSAAPWVAAVLTGRLMPRGTVQTLLDARDKQIAGLQGELERALAARDHEHDAVVIERQRSDDSAKAVMQLSREYGETMLHLARGGATGPGTA